MTSPDAMIAVRRVDNRIAVETIVSNSDFEGVVNTSYLDADGAIRLFAAGLELAREIKRDGGARCVK
jgi:hypothetical protein